MSDIKKKTDIILGIYQRGVYTSLVISVYHPDGPKWQDVGYHHIDSKECIELMGGLALASFVKSVITDRKIVDPVFHNGKERGGEGLVVHNDEKFSSVKLKPLEIGLFTEIVKLFE